MIHWPGLPDSPDACTGATPFFDIDHPRVRDFVAQTIGDAASPRERAIKLFYAVRDRIRYDPYRVSLATDFYLASRVIETDYGWCVSKAGLLAACARAVGIPSAIGLADVVNHLTSDKLRERMGGINVFYDHGYVALYLDRRWLKVVPAFNIELCRRFGVKPTEFDGEHDALYQEHDVHDRRHMEYLADHGTWSDMPLAKIRDDFAIHYPAMLTRDLDAQTAAETARFEDDAGR